MLAIPAAMLPGSGNMIDWSVPSERSAKMTGEVPAMVVKVGAEPEGSS